MNAVSLTETRARLSELVNKVEAGAEVVITRQGRPVARLLPIMPKLQPLPLKRLAELRKSLTVQPKNAAELLPKPLKVAKPVTHSSVVDILRDGRK